MSQNTTTCSASNSAWGLNATALWPKFTLQREKSFFSSGANRRESWATSFLGNSPPCFQEKRNLKRLLENKSFSINSLHIRADTLLIRSVCFFLLPAGGSQLWPGCITHASWSIQTFLHFICKCCQWCCLGWTAEVAGRWTEIPFSTLRFCKVYQLSVFWKMHHFRMWSSPCWNCSCLSNEAKSEDNPGLANWMFCNVDSRIITISRSKSVTRRCSWLVGFSVWLHNHR